MVRYKVIANVTYHVTFSELSDIHSPTFCKEHLEFIMQYLLSVHLAALLHLLFEHVGPLSQVPSPSLLSDLSQKQTQSVDTPWMLQNAIGLVAYFWNKLHKQFSSLEERTQFDHELYRIYKNSAHKQSRKLKESCYKPFSITLSL